MASVLIGLAAAFGAAIAYGVASVLQFLAARETARAVGLDPRLLLRLVRSWRYVLGLGLDGVGFVLTLVAVEVLPLFVVQSVVASSLAVTAVVGAVVLHASLRRRDVVGLVTVVGGLVLVALAAQADSATTVGRGAEWGLLVATLGLVVLAALVGRRSGALAVGALGTVAGLGYGVTSVAARLLSGTRWTDHPLTLVTHPATWALVVAGGLAILAYSTAMQRGSVTGATAPLVVGETVVPALVGLALLGDRTRAGWGWVAVLGFVLAVAGAVSLSRHGEVREGDAG